MHSVIHTCRDGLADLRARATLTIADFYAKIRRPTPKSAPRLHVVARGNMRHIIDRSTSTTRVFCGSYLKTQQFFDAMEAAATRKLFGRQ